MPTPKAIRLYLKPTKKGLKLVRTRRLNARAPAILGADKARTSRELDDRIGVMLDVADAEGNLLYRRRLPEFGRTYLEAYTGDKEQPFISSRKARPSLVTVLVPDVPEGAYVRILEQLTERPEKAKPPEKGPPSLKRRTLFEADFRKLRKQGGEP